MKEHPDYKYRPRRKPKTMVQKKTDTGVVSGKPVPYSVRDLLPQHETLATGAGGSAAAAQAAGSMAQQTPTAGEQQSAATVAKFSRAYFSPYQHHHYPTSFYQQVAKDLSTVASGGGATSTEAAAAGKAVHELALHALYGSSLYSRAVSLATGWPMMAAANAAVVGSNGGCPVNCAECGQHAERPARSPLQLPPRPAHESSTSSSTPSPPAQLPPPPLMSTATAAVIKRPIALLVKPDRVGPAALHAQHVI